jgi:hypothetical protein
MHDVESHFGLYKQQIALALFNHFACGANQNIFFRSLASHMMPGYITGVNLLYNSPASHGIFFSNINVEML